MDTIKDFTFFGSKKDWDHSHEVRRHWKKSFDTPRHHIKKQRHYFADKSLSSQSYGFPSSHVWSWTIKKAED